MMTFLSTKPAKASDMVAQPVSTRRTQAISGGAPKANLSDMIMTIMPITIANVMIIWIVICDSLLHSIRFCRVFQYADTIFHSRLFFSIPPICCGLKASGRFAAGALRSMCREPSFPRENLFINCQASSNWRRSSAWGIRFASTTSNSAGFPSSRLNQRW